MRVIRTVAACSAALALGGISAASASAETEYPLTGLPEVGRCVKITPGTAGKHTSFNTAQCLGHDVDENDGPWEWLPGPSAKGTFKMHLSSPTIETVGGGKIICTNAQITGEYTDGKGVKVSKTILQGCTRSPTSEACFSNALEKGVIESSQALTGAIGFIPNPKNEASPYVGLDLKAEPESLPLVMFNCGETLGVSVALEGSVIGKISKLNKMLTENGIQYQQKHGIQKIQAFKGGVKDTLTETVTPVTNPLEKTSEAAALAAIGPFETGEPIEIKAKQH